MTNTKPADYNGDISKGKEDPTPAYSNELDNFLKDTKWVLKIRSCLMDSSFHKQRTWISQISNTLEMNLEWKKNPPLQYTDM